MTRAAHILVLVALMAATVAAEDQNQFWLAAQHDWSGCRGFFFVVSAPFAPGHPSTLDDAKLIIGVGDGKAWHFISGRKEWKLDTAYTAKAVINNGNAELWIDGQRVANEAAPLAPAPLDLAFNEQPGFLKGPATYEVHQTRLLARGVGEPVQPEFKPASLPPQLLMF